MKKVSRENMPKRKDIQKCLIVAAAAFASSRKVIEWQQGDHYKAIDSTLLNHGEQVESVLSIHGVKW